MSKNAKNESKTAKNGQISKQKFNRFSASKLPKKIDTVG